jgi:type VI secretion system protein ImpJ
MGLNGHVHWHEGLFLQPHHLQTMQRGLLDSIAAERRLNWAYPYGVVEAKLSGDALENMLVRFDKLRVVMPGGLDVSFPDNADLPALDIKKAFESGSQGFTIRLGIPVWYASRGNAIEPGAEGGGGGGGDHRVKRLYRVSEIERADENTGENAQPVLVRRINARLMLESDDRTDMETIPLLKISHGAGEDVGLPKQDPQFVPPCMVLAGSPTLRELMRDLANQVEASRKELVIQITRGGFSVDTMRGVQFEQMLRLTTLNRFSGRLPSMVAAPGVTPFDIYLELRELLGELAALHPDRDQFEAAKYDHDNPAIALNELSMKIRGLLRGSVAARFMSLPFAKEGEIMVATLTEEHLSQGTEYFLGIKSREDPRAVAKQVENADEFKLMAKSMVARNIFGVRLESERTPPLELPSQTGLSYFRLMRSDSARMWDRIKEEKDIAVRWPGVEASDYAVTLYMTMAE